MQLCSYVRVAELTPRQRSFTMRFRESLLEKRMVIRSRCSWRPAFVQLESVR